MTESRVHRFIRLAQAAAADPAPIPANEADIAAAKAYARTKLTNPFAAARLLASNAESILRGKRALEPAGVEPTPPKDAA